MSESPLDLSTLFGRALQTVTAQREEVNALDGYNGNHGDNMVDNLRLIVDTLRSKRSRSPSDALQSAGQELQAHGRGGTSQYYARGLSRAAEELRDHPDLGGDEVETLVESLLAAIPSQGHPDRANIQESVLSQLAGLSGGQPSQATAQAGPAGGDLLSQLVGPADGGAEQAPAGGALLSQLMGLGGGGAPQAQAADQGRSGGDGLDLDDVVSTLLPAGLAFLQATQSGAETGTAAKHALMSILGGKQVNPLQAGTPRAAAGGLVAQSILRGLIGRR